MRNKSQTLALARRRRAGESLPIDSAATRRAIVPARAHFKSLALAVTAAAKRFAPARARLADLTHSEPDARLRAAFDILIGDNPRLALHLTGIAPRDLMRAHTRFKFAMKAARFFRQSADAGVAKMLWLDKKTKLHPPCAFRRGAPVNADEIAPALSKTAIS